MATNKYAQEGPQDTHQSTESNESRALTANNLSDELGNATLDGRLTDMHQARTAVLSLIHI